MPIDPQIALNTRGPELQSPLQVLGNAALMQERGTMNEERRQAAEMKRQQIQDQLDIRDALQANPNDPDEAVQWLYRTRANGRAAGALSKDLLATRKEQADGLATVIKGHKDTLDFLTNVYAGVSDQQSHDTFRSIAQPLLEKNGLGQVMSLIPPQYDPAQQKKVLAMGDGMKKQLDLEHQSIVNIGDLARQRHEANRDAEASEKFKREQRDNDIKTAAPYLSTTKSQQDLDSRLRFLVSQGHKPENLAIFGNQWSPQYGQNALTVAQTPSEVSAAADRKVGEDLRRREVAVQEAREAREAGGGVHNLTPGQRFAIESKKQAEYDKLEKARQNPKASEKPDDVVTAEATLKSPKTTKAARDQAQATIDAWKIQQGLQYGQEKLRIENTYRADIGLPSFEDTEAQIKARIANGQPLPTDARDLRIIRNKYRMVTGTPTMLEQMEQKAAALQRETDPAKRTELAKELKALRDQYRSTATSPVRATGGSTEEQ